jgi:hypothetical protein
MPNANMEVAQKSATMARNLACLTAKMLSGAYLTFTPRKDFGVVVPPWKIHRTRANCQLAESGLTIS